MLTAYIKMALRHAKYEILEEDKSFYGEIPELKGVYAHSVSLESCREELDEVYKPSFMKRCCLGARRQLL